MKEPNPFNDKKVADQWISSIETPLHNSREAGVYPLLKAWSGELKPGSVIVEIGSGQGVCSSKLDLNSKTYVGVEPSQFLVDRAKELYPEANKRFLSGDSYQTPLEDASADAVFSVGVWFHVSDLDEAHAEMKRILKPGGELLIITGNPNVQKTWESWFVNPKVDGKRIEGGINIPGGRLDSNIIFMHTNEVTRASLESNGFEVRSIEVIPAKKADVEGFWVAIRAIK